MNRTRKREHGALESIESANAAVRRADERALAAHNSVDCKLCNVGPDIPFSMAFQPIVDVRANEVVAYEALARGPGGEPAVSVLDHTLHNNRYSIDQRCREKAIGVSAALGLLDTAADLHVNFYPNAVYEPKQCLSRTLAAAQAVSFPLERIVFEITEVERVISKEHLAEIMREYKTHGLRLAIDDFGAGHSGLTLLSMFQPDMVKVDRALVERIDERPASQAIMRSVVQMCGDLGTEIIAEGVERAEEMQMLWEFGVFVMQGFYFSPPAFEALPQWPREDGSSVRVRT